MIYTNIKMAFASIRSSRTRSFLTMLGIIIGVMAVVVTVSIGEGIKKQVTKQVNQLGSNVIVIRPGKTIEKDKNGQISRFNFVSSLGASTLTEKDLAAIKTIANVEAIAPSALITATVSTEHAPNYQNALVIGTNTNMQQILNQEVEYGDFFTSDSSTKREAIIGSSVASNLFDQRDPIGQVMVIRGQDFIVRGVFKEFPNNFINIGQNYNDAIFIPYLTGKHLTNGVAEIRELNVKMNNSVLTEQTTQQIKQILLKNHSGQDDFTVLNQEEFLDATNQVFNIITTFVAAIAGISLIVGGIGIMNIMLVSVSERTREIGVRKAIGASNKQILGQFLVEAVVLSVAGGFIGVFLSIVAAYILRMTTSLRPSISLFTIIVAIGVSTIVGVIFGMAPAIKAARKDPISALRHE